jgi:redox-sensitive bicupin YhaK (pirin superfamily)
MIQKRPAAERGIVDHGWLLARHSFSFAGYQDPRHVRFRTLRVINEDTVQPGQGFGTHGHEDMEILTYVLSGAVEHRDSMGEHGVLRPGDVQMMSAGTGVTHSEVNASRTEPLHLLQIWIFPDARGYAPRYEDRHFPAEERRNALRRIAGPDGTPDALPLHQDAQVFASLLDAGRSLSHPLGEGRGAWLQVARGALDLNGHRLEAGDGAAVEGEAELSITAAADAEFLLFDLG